MSAYESVIRLPYRLIVQAAQIERQRRAEERLIYLSDAAITDGLDRGRVYVDPKNPPEQGGPHYDLTPYVRHMQMVEQMARPWLYTPEAIRVRREAEEDVMWAKTLDALGGVQA